PTEFSAKAGSPNLLITLKRVKAATPAAVAVPVPLQPAQPAPVKLKDDDLRKLLVGTWGHQDDDWLTYFTVNGDGTFTSIRNYKKKFGKLFHEDIRSSGTWKLTDGMMYATITGSSDSELRGQIYSFRVRTISPTEVIYVDQFGRLRREWKVR